MENDAAHTNLTEIKSKHARHVFSFTLSVSKFITIFIKTWAVYTAVSQMS